MPRPREALWRAAVSRALIAETCRRAANESAAQAGDDAYVEIRETGEDGTAALHYDGAGGGMPEDLCGAIRFSGLEADGAPGIAAQGHRRALTGLLPAIRAIASRLAAHYVPGTSVYGRPLPDIDGLLAGQDLAGAYARVLDDALTRAASEERETLSRVVAEDAREASWMAAASFFNTIAHRAGLFQAAAHNVPAVALPVPSLERWAPAADAAVKGLAAQLARSCHYHPMLLSAATSGAGALPAAEGDGGGVVSGLLEFIDLDSVIVADSGNPIADLAALGHGLLNAALAAIAVLMGAATGSGLLESIPFIGKGLDVFESAWQVSDALVSTLLGILIVAGAVLAYVLPALPFIRFLFGILAWILNVVVAVLAVTVFAAAHVTREDGNRLTTQVTRQGWLFLPALVLRPPPDAARPDPRLLRVPRRYRPLQRGLAAPDARRRRLRKPRPGGLPRHARPLRLRRLRADERLLQADRPAALGRPRLDRRARGRRRRRQRAGRRRGRRRHLPDGGLADRRPSKAQRRVRSRLTVPRPECIP